MASLYLDPIGPEKSKSVDEKTKSVSETLTQEGSEIRNTVTPVTDGGDNPKIDDIADVGNIVD
ncbi:hypothetical protein A2U01_0104103, partial [Trifolium medium]|nr:hypothetical protein [Trifolium medium]